VFYFVSGFYYIKDKNRKKQFNKEAKIHTDRTQVEIASPFCGDISIKTISFSVIS